MPRTTVTRWKDLDPAIRRMKGFPKAFQKEAKKAMDESVALFKAEVEERTPVGATEKLSEAIYGEVTSVPFVEVTGTVGANPDIAPYAPFVEEDTVPHWPPKGALTAWVEKVLGVTGDAVARVEFLVRRKISIKGTKGQHMFRRGWNASRKRVQAIWVKMANRIPRKHFRQ